MISAALMCHPSRERFVAELTEQLPSAEVVWDQDNDRWSTGRRSLLAFDPAAELHVVVQDDALICPDFLAGAEVAASVAGERPVALYTGKVRPHAQTVTPAVRYARKAGIPWLAMEGPWWGVAIVLPTSLIPSLVKWCDEHPRTANYDRRIAHYFTAQRIDCWYTIPSLVDHRPVAENPSLVRGRTGNRQAHWFIGERSPLEIDWGKPPVRLEIRFDNGKRSRRVRAGSARHLRMLKDPAWKEAA